MFKVILKWLVNTLNLTCVAAIVSGVNEIVWGNYSDQKHKNKIEKYFMRTVLSILSVFLVLYSAFKIMTDKK